MARDVIEAPAKDRTTIVASKHLLDRLSIHVRKNGDNQTDFIQRAIINQMEKEGDLTIRSEMEDEANGC
ncbi:hypothetical protein IKN40_08665 [bacterium]|nr:hypothetical protein [bacterium]